MNKKLLLTGISVLSSAVVLGTIFSANNSIDVFAQSRVYTPSLTTVDISRITNVSEMTQWPGYGYYTFSGSGTSSQGAVVNLLDYGEDENTSWGSYFYVDPSQDYNSSVSYTNEYMFKMNCLDPDYCPAIEIQVMIHEKATINNDDTYISYTASYESGEYKHMAYTSWNVYEDPNTGDYYAVYIWYITITNTQVGNSLTIHNLHVEYMC